MSLPLFLSVHLPEKQNERLRINDLSITTKKILDLKVETGKLLSLSHDDLGKSKSADDFPQEIMSNSFQSLFIEASFWLMTMNRYNSTESMVDQQFRFC